MHRTTQNIDLRLLFWGPVFLPMFLSLFNYLSFSLRRYASLLSYRTLYAGNRWINNMFRSYMDGQPAGFRTFPWPQSAVESGHA
jgi:hypothetical protein